VLGGVPRHAFGFCFLPLCHDVSARL
jgi:hypothetical protein